MSGYFNTASFGMRDISLKGAKAATAIYAGANVTKGVNTYSTAKAAGGLDFGKNSGTFNLELILKVKVIKTITQDAAVTDDSVKIELMSSEDNATFTSIASYTTSVASLNAAKLKNTITFSAVPTMGQYFCIGITPTSAVTDGQILIEALPKGY